MSYKMNFPNHRDSTAYVPQASPNIIGSCASPGAVCKHNRSEMGFKAGGLHAIGSPALSYNNALPHTVTIQWLTGVSKSYPDFDHQESKHMMGNENKKTVMGLGIRHVPNSRFEYALSSNPASDFVGDRTLLGLGIRQVPKSRFEYALSENPSADFIGDKTPIGLGIRHLSNGKFEYALSANPSSDFTGGGQMAGLQILPEELRNGNNITIKNPSSAPNASPPVPIKKDAACS